MDRPQKVCRATYAVSDGYVTVSVPLDMTDGDWDDLAEIVQIMRRQHARVAERKRVELPKQDQ